MLRFTSLLFIGFLSFLIPETKGEFRSEFGDDAGTFILLDGQTGKKEVYNTERSNQRFSPCSTFKIPATLIALETKAVTDPDATIPWKEKKYPKNTLYLQEWARSMSLKDAFKLSCVWFYKETAEKVGPEKMEQYLKEFNYGNKDTSGGPTSFWLMSSLEISAEEQINFLKGIHERKFNLRPETYDIAENVIFIEEKTPEWTLRAKTGTGRQKNGKYIAWYVGYVTKGENVWYFAMNIDSEKMDRNRRKEITRAILKKNNIID